MGALLSAVGDAERPLLRSPPGPAMPGMGRKRSLASKSQPFEDGFPMNLDCSRYSLRFFLLHNS
jgi:hypothetical protein